MKFKYNDLVEINSEFYGKHEGMIIDYAESMGGTAYRVAFIIDGRSLVKDFDEKKLKKVKD